MKTLKDIRAKRLYIFFAEQMCNLLGECNKTIELICNGQVGKCYKRLIREQDKKIKTIRLCISICEGLQNKYNCDVVEEDWISARKQELINIIDFYC